MKDHDSHWPSRLPLWPHPTGHNPLGFLQGSHTWVLPAHPAVLPQPRPAPAHPPASAPRGAVSSLPFWWDSLKMNWQHHSLSQMQFDIVCEGALHHHLSQVASSVRAGMVFGVTSLFSSASTMSDLKEQPKMIREIHITIYGGGRDDSVLTQCQVLCQGHIGSLWQISLLRPIL